MSRLWSGGAQRAAAAPAKSSLLPLLGIALFACKSLTPDPPPASARQTLSAEQGSQDAAFARMGELPAWEDDSGDLLEPWADEAAPSNEELLALDVPGRKPPPITIPEPAGPSQVAVWRGGKQIRLMEHAEAVDLGLIILDIGTEWVPHMFRSVDGYPHAYQTDFADLANRRFHDDAQGRRAKRDLYLELYGIPPSPAVLAQRFAKFDGASCARHFPGEVIRQFEGADWSDKGEPPEVPQPVVEALQDRLVCATHLRTRPSGRLDLHTRYALEEFERRNRIYARGSLRGKTLRSLQTEPLVLELKALIRTLTERLVLDLGVIEDGGARGVTPVGEEASSRMVLGGAPDMVGRVERAVVRAFGLRDVDAARTFYRQLGEVLTREHYFVAIPPIDFPSYYDDDMDLFVEIDRGDVYYDFPYEDDGKRRAQPIENHPTLTLFARTKRRGGRRGPKIIPLAHYGTTIGGWRIQRVGERDLWTYKESPVGQRVWSRIVSAPVWLPPAKTPPDTLIYQARTNDEGEPVFEVNENLVGPGYASAYGLVAAYHQQFSVRDGRRVPTRDEGIRSHGSSDYTSIWQSASLGCHRLHNHLALRLFNFILAHRPHRRAGHRSAGFRMPVSLQGFETVIEVNRTGYSFVLREPLLVEVLPGRVAGERKRPPNYRVPVEEVSANDN